MTKADRGITTTSERSVTHDDLTLDLRHLLVPAVGHAVVACAGYRDVRVTSAPGLTVA